MPLLNKEPFSRVSLADDIDSDAEVFYCKTTNEAFTDYETILCSSMVWTCSVTGKSGLTFQEALESEANANSMLSAFPESLQVPVLFLMSYIKEHKLSNIIDMINIYLANRYFVNEDVYVIVNDRRIKARICGVIAPNEKASVKTSVDCEETSVSYGIDPALYKYEVEDTSSGLKVVVGAERVTRPKGMLSKDKLRLFLKQHIAAEKRFQIMKVNESSAKLFDLQNFHWKDIFGGPLPNFESKTKVVRTFNKDKVKAAQKVKHKSEESSSPKLSKQSKTEGSKEAKEKAKLKEKHNVDKEKEKELLKQQKLEQRMLERQRIKEEKKKREQFFQEWCKKREDLECDDLKPLPIMTPIDCEIPKECFGDALMVMEFFYNFNELFNIKNIFPHGLNFELMEDILTKNEIVGPLGDVIEILLRTIFELQEEENRLPIPETIDSDSSNSDEESDAEDSPVFNDDLNTAIKIANSLSLRPLENYGIPLSEMEFTPFTITEILRLHILSSGAGKQRKSKQKGSVSGREDPCLWLRMKNPDLIKSLSSRTIFELTINERLNIISALISQILSFTRFRDFIDEAFDKAIELKKQLREMEKSLRPDSKSDKKSETKRLKKELENILKSSTESTEAFDKSDENNEEADNEKALRSKRKIEEIKLQIRQIQSCFRVKPLGVDRWFRKYWWFNSIGGLFVDHDDVKIDQCSSTCPTLFSLASNSKCFVALEDMKNMPLNYYDLKFFNHIFGDDRSTASDKENDYSSPPRVSKTDSERNSIGPKIQLIHVSRDGCEYCVPANLLVDLDLKWAFIHKSEDIDSLIYNLNNRGFRESELKKNLLNIKSCLKESLEACPISILNKNIQIDEQRKSKKNFHKMRWNDFYGNMDPKLAEELALRDNLLYMEEKLFDGGLCVIEDREAWLEAVKTDKATDDKVTYFIYWAELIITLAEGIGSQFLQNPLAEQNGAFERWQKSLQSCTSVSQLFLHLNILNKSVLWSKSATRASCTICKRRKNSDQMLLCDQCNSGYHIYCLQPPLNKIPENEWYCDRCVQLRPLSPRKLRDNKLKYKEVSSDEDMESESDGENEQDNFSDNDDEDLDESKSVSSISSKSDRTTKCAICGWENPDIKCEKCNKNFHNECHSPPVKRALRKMMSCMKCSAVDKEQEQSKQIRSTRKRKAKYDEDFDYKSGSLIEDSIEDKRPKPKRHNLNRNLPLDYKKCSDLLKKLAQHEASWPFQKVPKSKEAPNYNNIVKHHVDFGLITTKLNTGTYKSNTEFFGDIYLMLQNCELYWPRKSEQYRAGKRLTVCLEQLLSEYGFDKIKHSFR
ncbi:Bromodomain adjacent to zinc finger domain protein 1A-like protein [Dinothrombium tinctorium]|uniref:Bromodomain adjacent to zinc finger domain protein 1A n=1 Tax=Dinothrombium tinctorium TaxID=1965070 RepID=A0A443RKM8_9ACAR|nr:Bromodomain adjacent to zinc finger domain protein 1A-like protein [Dinothrombium tinctorium]